jgi:plasmid stabilization system protein ParE
VKLRYTRPALADLGAILDYIDAQSPRGAGRVMARIERVIDLLLVHPNLGRRTSNPLLRRIGVSPYPLSDFLSTDGKRDYRSRHTSCGS